MRSVRDECWQESVRKTRFKCSRIVLKPATAADTTKVTSKLFSDQNNYIYSEALKCLPYMWITFKILKSLTDYSQTGQMGIESEVAAANFRKIISKSTVNIIRQWLSQTIGPSTVKKQMYQTLVGL